MRNSRKAGAKGVAGAANGGACSARPALDFRTIAERAPDPIFIQTDGKFAYLNPAACAFFGIGSPEELIGTPILDRVGPEFRELAKERIRRLNEDSTPVNELVEQRFLRLDGSSAWAQTKGEPIIYDGISGALVFARGTEKCRAAEEAFQASQQKYETLFHKANIPILLLKFPGLEIIEVNEAWTAHFGYSPDEVLGRRAEDLGITRSGGAANLMTKELERTGSLSGVELKVYTKSGEERTVLSNINVLSLDGGQVALITNLDITERKEAEKKLYKVSEKFQKFFDHSAVGMVVTGLDGRLLDVNRKMCEMFGYAREELEGTHFSNITYAEDIPVSNDMVRRMLSGESRSVVFEKRYVRRNGEVFWASAISTVQRDQADRPEQFLTQLQDITDRKESEVQLREISERYRMTFDHSPIAVSLIDMGGIIVDFNKKMCEIFGYTEEALVGKWFRRLTHPDDFDSAMLGIGRLISDEAQAVTFEKRYIRSDGEVFWAVVTAALLRDANDSPAHIIVQMQDITERRRMLQELRAREEFSRAVMDNLPIGISVNTIEPPLVFEYMNDNFPRFYRTTREAIQREDAFFGAVYEDPEFRETIRARVLADMQSGDPERMRWDNVPITRKGAETSYISAYNALVPGRDMHISIVTDETERVLSLKALEKYVTRFRRLYEFDQEIIRGFKSTCEIGEMALKYLFEFIAPAKAAVGLFDPDGDGIELVTAVNKGRRFRRSRLSLTAEERAAARLLQKGIVCGFGDIRDETLSALIRRLFGSAEGSGFVRALYAETGPTGLLFTSGLGPGGLSDTDKDIVQEIGLQTALAIGQYRLRIENNKYAAGLEQMIGERTAQLEEAVKELEAFTYSVSHDLRAPLRTLNGFVNILLEDYGGALDDEGRRVCDVIGNGARQMGRLIDDLLALSRVGRSSMALMPVDMETMVRSLFSELTTEGQRSRIVLTVGSLPQAAADPTLIRQVWMNLLDNAVKFTSKKPEARIEIAGVADGDEIVYSVTDNGAGFNMKYQNKLFGVFQRLHSTKEFEGTGVGLAVVNRVVCRHGGRVWARGEEDKGATFYFSLKKEANPNVI